MNFYNNQRKTWFERPLKTLYALMIFSAISKETTEASTATSQAYFYMNTDTRCRQSDLGTSWTAENEISCARECMARFQDTCTNFVFNTLTQDCKPVQPYATSIIYDIPPSQLGDVLYSKDVGRFLNCDKATGYDLYTNCGAAACLMPSVGSLTYYSAKSACVVRNGTLMAPNTFERKTLYTSIVQDNPSFQTTVWLGLNKFGGSWAWETGEELDSDLAATLWANGQPDDLFSETCAAYIYTSRVHSTACTNYNIYFCEQNY